MRSRFTELCNYLKSKKAILLFADEQFDSVVENSKAEPGGLNETEQGLHFMNIRYRGVIFIERLPEHAAGLLMAMVTAWLLDNDNTRDDHDLEDPDFEFTDLNENSEYPLTDVEICIDFLDPCYLSESETGLIEYDGKKWNDDDFIFDIAESGDVTHGGT